jgi:uncharacterized protein YcfJ
MGRILRAIENLWVKIGVTLGIFSFLITIAAFFNLSRTELALILLIIITVAIFFAIVYIGREVDDVVKELPSMCRYRVTAQNGGAEEEEEAEVRPSGVGAFGGMIAGGALGLPFGPIGVLVGGVIGALIGNQLEYETLEEEMRKKAARR